MIVSSTYFQGKNIHKVTWTAPDGDYHNQIYHILIEKRGAFSILGVWTRRGANMKSNHYMVEMKFTCRLNLICKEYMPVKKKKVYEPAN